MRGLKGGQSWEATLRANAHPKPDPVAVHYTSCPTSFYFSATLTFNFSFLLNAVFYLSYKEDALLLRCGMYDSSLSGKHTLRSETNLSFLYVFDLDDDLDSLSSIVQGFEVVVHCRHGPTLTNYSGQLLFRHRHRQHVLV